jgi:hypothetical protein
MPRPRKSFVNEFIAPKTKRRKPLTTNETHIRRSIKEIVKFSQPWGEDILLWTLHTVCCQSFNDLARDLNIPLAAIRNRARYTDHDMKNHLLDIRDALERDSYPDPAFRALTNARIRFIDRVLGDSLNPHTKKLMRRINTIKRTRHPEPNRMERDFAATEQERTPTHLTYPTTRPNTRSKSKKMTITPHPTRESRAGPHPRIDTLIKEADQIKAKTENWDNQQPSLFSTENELKSKYVGTCKICGAAQYNTSGHIICKNGHSANENTVPRS